MLRLLSLLQARPNWTGPELAGRLEVTDRTLRRDITRLRDLGYPVEAFSGPAGGYRLAAGGALPPLLLEDDEAVVVAMGLRTAAAGALPGFEDAAVAALAKIEQVLPLRLRERIGDLDSSIVSLTRAQPRASQIDADDLVALARACRLPERLRFAYIDSEGRASERHVEPFQLVHAARRWYLVAFDRDREAWRTFRVDRIDQIQPTGMRFTHRDPPDAAGLVAEGLAVSVYRWQARVLLRVKPEVARSFISPATGVIGPTRGGTLLRIGADDLDWIARMLAGYPCPFKVLDPPELRAAVADLAKELASYSS
jgi:predicted DNA-binding transcriptional regulator YafY